MIIGLGIDAVEIKRLSHWHTYSRKQLSRIFSQEEIDYCLRIPIKSSERFAARLAAKEAFYKALSTAYTDFTIPFLTICPLISIKKTEKQTPCLSVQWNKLTIKHKYMDILLSLSHTANMAIAAVILTKKD